MPNPIQRKSQPELRTNRHESVGCGCRTEVTPSRVSGIPAQPRGQLVATPENARIPEFAARVVEGTWLTLFRGVVSLNLG